MSEPMSSHEIEDVLSSIRRLVSEDLRPAPRSPDAEPESAPADKLLLTPALRVVTAPDALDPEPDTIAAAPADSPADLVEDVVARLGAAVTEDDWESPFGDPEVWSGSEQADRAPEAAQGFVAHARMPLAEPPTGPVAEDMPLEFIDAPMAGFAEVEDVLPEPAPAESEFRREPLRRVTPPQDDSSWADEAEAAVRADLAQEAEEEVISGLYEAQAGGLMFDEEVLRDLVRDLIREELSGALGERITRNVRKLVRAEIARAMALREFE